MKAKKLANNLGISVEEAETLMAKYMDKWVAVRRYFEETEKSLTEDGYVYTYLGRRRFLPDIKSPRDYQRFRAGRQGANSVIQGCQPGSTKVLTRQGYLRLDAMPERGEVWTGMVWAPYTLLNRGEWQLAEIHFDNGQVLKCDTRHKVLTCGPEEYVFKEFSELKEGDRVAFTLAQPLEYGATPQGMSEPDFYWMGYAIGNGCTSLGVGHPNALSICFGDRKGRYRGTDQAILFETYLRSRGWFCQAPQANAGQTKTSVTVEGRKIRATWESWGYPWGALSSTKRIPHSVWSASLRDRKAFLLGLLDADGTVGEDGHSPCIHLCQRELLEEVMILARTCGVQSRLTGPFNHRGHTSYQLHMVGRHTAMHLKYGRMPSKHTVPNMGLPLEVARRAMAAAPKAQSESELTLHARVRKGGTLGAYTANDMLRGQVVEELYASSAVRKLVVLERRETTYTLAVEHPSHRFDSEGVITKNTAAEIAKCAMLRLFYDKRLQSIGWQMLSQIHDELVCEGPEETKDEAKAIVKEAMEHPFAPDLEFGAPLSGSPAVGPNWYACK
jgi:hypothetical protein